MSIALTTRRISGEIGWLSRARANTENRGANRCRSGAYTINAGGGGDDWASATCAPFRPLSRRRGGPNEVRRSGTTPTILTVVTTSLPARRSRQVTYRPTADSFGHQYRAAVSLMIV